MAEPPAREAVAALPDDGRDAPAVLVAAVGIAPVAGMLSEWCRLTGSHLGRPRSPLDAAVDRATGRDAQEMDRFAAFVREAVERMPAGDRGREG